MKRTNWVILSLVALVVWVPLLMGAWDKDKPAATTSLRASNPEILANFDALETSIGQDHEFSTGGTNSGKHTQVTFDDPISTPAAVTVNEGVLYIKDDDPDGAGAVVAKAELFFIDEDENDIQLTSVGTRLPNATYFTGADAAGTGSVNIFKIHTDDTIHIGAATTVNGTLAITGNVTLDKGATNSPIFTMTDVTNNSAAFEKVDGDNLKITTVAGEGVEIVTGNLVVGDGTPDVTLDGEDVYIQGTLEVDGLANIGGAVTVGGALTVTGAATGILKAYAGAAVFSTTMTAANTFQDLDLSAIVGANTALCFFEIKNLNAGAPAFAMKPKGQGGTFTDHGPFTSGGGSYVDFTAVDEYVYMTILTDTTGCVQIGAENNTSNITIKLLAYIK